MTATPVNLFVYDPVFLDRSSPFFSILNSGGVGTLSSVGLSYFQSVYEAPDKRAPSTRVVGWQPETAPVLIVDEIEYSSFVNVFNIISDSERAGIFKIIDKLAFDFSASAALTDIETFLTKDADISPIYEPGTFKLNTEAVSATAHSQTNAGVNTVVSVPQYVEFQINIGKQGSVVNSFTVTAWIYESAFLKGYPVSIIEEVVPPLPYSTILSAPLVGTTDNVFTTAKTAAQLNASTLKPSLDVTENSGYVSYNASAYDTSGNVAPLVFNILYRGAVPTQIQIRAAIRNAALNSGYGDATQWKQRIPELFINSRFYLIPIWDDVKAMPDLNIYPSVADVSTLLVSVGKVITTMSASDIASAIQLLVVPFNRMVVASLPDTIDNQTQTTLLAMFPSFQCYATTDPNFQYMDSATQQFSLSLNTVMSVITGSSTSDVYTKVTDGQLEYISFTQGATEFCVISETCYRTMVGATT